MKTERDYGFEYAESIQATLFITAKQVISGTISIPSNVFNSMIVSGIINPNRMKFWSGYNEYVEGND